MFPKPENIIVENFRGGIKDILGAILREDSENHSNFYELANELKGKTKRETARNIWSFIRGNIRYAPDSGAEVIKSPAKLLYDGVGDCKSMAILAAAILKNLGIKYKYRLVFYDKNKPEQGHIYIVVNDGSKIVIDPVYDKFDKELSYWKKVDV